MGRRRSSIESVNGNVYHLFESFVRVFWLIFSEERSAKALNFLFLVIKIGE